MFQKVKQTVNMWWWLRAFCWLVVEHSSTFYWSWPKTITRWDNIPIFSISYLADKVWLNSILLKYKILNTYCRGSMNLGWSSASRQLASTSLCSPPDDCQCPHIFYFGLPSYLPSYLWSLPSWSFCNIIYVLLCPKQLLTVMVAMMSKSSV